MHHCFEIPELVDEIVSHIPSREDYKPFLAVLARTARLFHDSTLNRLWRSQSSLHALLLCMPPDLVQEEFLNGKRSLNFLRPIQSSDWERPRQYARRVRTFSSLLDFDEFPYSAICPLLALDAADDSIFPNLTHLLWEQSDENFPHIGLFLGPNITVLSIRCDTSLSLATLFLLPRKSPSVTRLDIRHPRDDSVTEPTMKVVSPLIRELRCIQYLHMHIYDMAVLQHIARLPCLRSLSVQSVPTTLAAPPRAEGPLFTSLHRLQCEEPHPSAMSRLFKLCLDNTLNTFELDIRCRDTTQRIRPLLATLASSQRSLADLQIRVWHPDEITDAMECLRPALGFAKLTHFHFLSSARFTFDDLAISEMARAWPELESFNIMRLGHAEGVRTTLQSLQCLALHCQNLRTVSMDFTTDIIPSVGDAPSSNQCMSRLNVEQSSIPASQVHPVAQFLGGIFPNLQEVSSYGIGEHLDDDRWEEIEALLPSHVGESTRMRPVEP